MVGRPSSIRTVEVCPSAGADEVSWVFITAAFVVLVVIYVSAFERYGWSGSTAATRTGADLLPFQVLFRDLPSAEQRVFREMQEGAGEAVRARGTTAEWPSVEALSADGIPPFARDVIDKTGMRWSFRRDGLTVNYLGIPAVSDTVPAFLILIREPDPVTGEKPPPPSVVDEEHQLLPDGTLLHVTYWKGSLSTPRRGVIADPALAGWRQIRIKTLFEEMEGRK